MPTDDEFRRIAEDARTLLRSLAREARDAMEGARMQGDWTARQARMDARRMARQAKYNLRAGWGWGEPGAEGWSGPGARWRGWGEHWGGWGWGGPEEQRDWPGTEEDERGDPTKDAGPAAASGDTEEIKTHPDEESGRPGPGRPGAGEPGPGGPGPGGPGPGGPEPGGPGPGARPWGGPGWGRPPWGRPPWAGWCGPGAKGWVRPGATGWGGPGRPGPGEPGSSEPGSAGGEPGWGGSGGPGWGGSGRGGYGPGGPGPGWHRRPYWAPGAGGPPEAGGQVRRGRPTRPPLRHRWDGMTVLGMLAVLFGVAGILAAAHALTAPLEGVVAVGLMLLGAALVVTGRTDWSLSRRHWPVWLGVGMILVLFATSSTFGMRHVGLHFGRTSYTAPASPNALVSEVSGGFGPTKVNLSPLQGPLPKAKTIEVDADAGPVSITLPHNIPIHLDARVLGGVVMCSAGQGVLGRGANVHVVQDLRGQGPVLTVDVHDLGGQIQINGACS